MLLLGLLLTTVDADVVEEDGAANAPGAVPANNASKRLYVLSSTDRFFLTQTPFES